MFKCTCTAFTEWALFFSAEPLLDARLAENSRLAFTTELGRVEKAILLANYACEDILH